MFDTLMKHAKHFTNKEHANKMASVVHLYESGELFMTDAVTAVAVKNVNPKKENYTLKSNGERSDIDVYMDYRRFFSGEHSFEVELDVSEILLMTQAFEAVNRYEAEPDEEANDTGKFKIEVIEGKLCAFYRGKNVTSKYELTEIEGDFKRSLTISLITKTMKLLKDLKFEKCILKGASSKLRPIVFSPVGIDDIEIVVMPCRDYE